MVDKGNMAEVNVGDEFEPGDVVPKSGIYRVIHDLGHTQPHEVTCIYGKRFPPCHGCGHHPRFRLVTAAQHIETHDLFKEIVRST
jgi:hypothetical protein